MFHKYLLHFSVLNPWWYTNLSSLVLWLVTDTSFDQKTFKVNSHKGTTYSYSFCYSRALQDVRCVARARGADLQLEKFPQLVCASCRDDFQSLVAFRWRINEGQRILHQLQGRGHRQYRRPIRNPAFSKAAPDPNNFFSKLFCFFLR